jgi:type IV pilus assembly protein PilW
MKTTAIGARDRKAQRGMTIIELMIATAIGLFVLLGVTYAYISNRQSYVLNEALANIQESARVISEALNHDLRMAGSTGCNPEASTFTVPGVGLAGAKQIKSGVRVSPAVSGVVGRDGGKPVLTIYGALGDGMASVSAEATSSSIPIELSASKEKLEKNMGGEGYMIISDCEKSLLFSGTISGSSITITEGGDGLGGGGETGGDIYAKGAQVFGIAPVVSGGSGVPYKAFYLGSSGRTDVAGESIRSLFYGNTGDPIHDMELAEGVDAFRICVGEENGNTIKRVPDTGTGISWEKVTMVQVDMVLSSINPRVLQEDVMYKYELCGDAGGTPSVTVKDRRMRRMFSTSVALRSKLPWVPPADSAPKEYATP